MTRLTVNDIKDLTAQLLLYDTLLQLQTGTTLQGIACYALGITSQQLQVCIPSTLIAVVPIMSGQGVIGGFSSTVAAIVQHIGFKSFVTREPDVAGLAEAVEAGAAIVMMADDKRFIALDTRNSRVVDNTPSTARGFVAGLELMIRHQAPTPKVGLKDRELLIIGCGAVGTYSAIEAIKRGARVSLFDIHQQRSSAAAMEIMRITGSSSRISIEPALAPALSRHSFIIEATNAANTIQKSDINPHTYIAAPGVPLGLTSAAIQQIKLRLLHDPLQIGTAVMAVDAAVHYFRKNQQ